MDIASHPKTTSASTLLQQFGLNLFKIKRLESCRQCLSRCYPTRYLNLVAKADVILDTLYYTGGANTAYDAIAVGTPYVTLPFELHRSRFGAAAYRQIGVTDVITEKETDYVEKAIQIANDQTYRQQLKKRILANAHLVFEDMKAVRELEYFFEYAILR
jgi:predicted O-linked N-acetylglucosamine transferase (SPINDLY family)